MKKQLMTAVFITAFSSTAALANNNDTEKAYEKKSFIGFSSGAVTGAIVGGPVGAVLGATLGVFIGSIEELDEEKQHLTQQLQKQQTQLTSNQQEKAALVKRLQQVSQQQHMLTEQLSLAKQTMSSAELVEKLKLNLQFKINSSDVESHYQQQIEQLAQLVQQNKQLTIQLSGFADRNGDEQHNLALSEKRINAVKALLMSHGISEENISSQALGEQAPIVAEQNYQNDFFDRRVEVQLIPKQVLTAGN